jgi:hypothetical protein
MKKDTYGESDGKGGMIFMCVSGGIFLALIITGLVIFFS